MNVFLSVATAAAAAFVARASWNTALVGALIMRLHDPAWRGSEAAITSFGSPS